MPKLIHGWSENICRGFRWKLVAHDHKHINIDTCSLRTYTQIDWLVGVETKSRTKHYKKNERHPQQNYMDPCKDMPRLQACLKATCILGFGSKLVSHDHITWSGSTRAWRAHVCANRLTCLSWNQTYNQTFDKSKSRLHHGDDMCIDRSNIFKSYFGKQTLAIGCDTYWP